MKNFVYLLPMLIIINFVFLGCAKDDDEESTATTTSSSSTTINVSAESGSSAITLSSKVSVVEPKSSESTATSRTDSTARTSYAIDTSAFASTVDYNKDETQTFVFEQSSEALNTVNNILCQINQTRPDLMVNEGNYKAQIDTKKCGEGDGDSESNAPTYEMWTLNVSREDGQPMKAKVWVPNDDAIIYVYGEWYQSPSDGFPLGAFKMNFTARMGETFSGMEGMFGFMSANSTGDGEKTTLQFYNKMDSAMWGMDAGTDLIEQVTVNLDPTNDTGTGITSLPNISCTGPDTCEISGEKVYKLAYSDDYFYKQKTTSSGDGDPICLDRGKYRSSAWRYGMYDSAGARVEINSGFPISATKDGTDYNGYIGYYGLWMPDAAGVEDGSTVKKMDYDNPENEGDEYTLRSYGGKLVKYTKQTITLGSIKNIPLNWYDQSANYEKRIFWNGTNFTVDAYRNQSTNWQWADMTTATTFDLSADNAQYGFSFYSQALGGDGQIVLVYATRGSAPTAPTDSSSVIFNTQTPIFPGDTVPATLACYDRCPNPSTLATGSDAWGAESSIFHGKKWLGWDSTVGEYGGWVKGSGDMDNSSAPDPYTYTFDSTTGGMLLKYGGTDVVLSSANSNVEYGARSGILFDNSTFDNDTAARQADFASLICEWDSTKICPWQARGGVSTFYVWETGVQEWNKLTILESGGTPVKFDPPMIVKYTHSGTTSNSGKSYDGSSFYLEYGGFGDLWGVPSYCVNAKSGKKVDCASDGSTRWINEFVVPAASLATNAADSTVEYVIKPLEIEQMMEQTDSTSSCTDEGLELGGIDLPSADDYEAPDIGDRPTVTGPPSIVGGVKTGS